MKLFARAADEDQFVRDAIDDHTAAFRDQTRMTTAYTSTLVLMNATLIVSMAAVALWQWSVGQIAIGAVATAIPLAWQLNNIAGWVARSVTSIFENIGTVQDGMRSIDVPRQMPDPPNAAELVVTGGEIRIDGESVGGRNFRKVRRNIGYLPENLALYDNLTGLETLHFFARLKGAAVGQCAAKLELVGLRHAATRRVREYSKGMRQRLGFAQALLGEPRLLFLDEPTNGLDPEAIREFFAILRGLQNDGVTMILTSHILADIQERVDRLAIMKSGKIQSCGSVQALRETVRLPLLLEIGGTLSTEQVAMALHGLPVISIEARQERLWVRLPREAKMQALARLVALGDGMQDLHVREPSLEDVFFGLAEE
ncbi:putative ABC transporter ATP-binding protein YxlF [mine drainage metagenome]|uniref:Putative ABC transporter ATP-binding protein YxlF n=1 Tax=mine drainage metagenome TaxID=410659 RepID=A0A1J5QLB1_9ZZZZ